ncbi:hypothetical protein H112_08182 [Trichophyton rubrum D6]|uniref:Uncharacterized protein n=2 Tax=Trichophyton rubrum TaxID=5551 RepID=F2SD57_TRIRC|nr:uncharacterized protein TERG_00757 [Trichophyton rubrum CBS 118892]EZF10562.1 hypothetical protein H100_08210 [Trichophyton rubrum MR850]EZF37466.1 hypothetical protein H102_08167 [Trichophyton rubrum CBS 100081]EZF48092.1 hypothetical protein H103_08192 [Trichophyton rubrum CBS 288.86]EZF58758.1 hypothetical protein H104_08143 [Trichophyton rubrum CBS 289.86]EZF80004.1 hypothetical protein H110_08189 [Trichophyton rubrum MR1448]EZF90689.1 hypothetical protein H113_08257 [Trichophyton rubr
MESKLYEEVWVTSCYTSLTMLEFILQHVTACKLEVELGDFVPGEISIDKARVREILRNTGVAELAPLWKNGTGLCTSFAIQVASRIDCSDYPSSFIFGELDGYRACFNAGGFIIDSSARKALLIQDGKPISAYKGMWNLAKVDHDLVLSFQIDFKSFNRLDGYTQAINHCILQLCNQKSFICMFRF